MRARNINTVVQKVTISQLRVELSELLERKQNCGICVTLNNHSFLFISIINNFVEMINQRVEFLRYYQVIEIKSPAVAYEL